MTKMKDSGIDWIGEIPEEWKLKRLKYVIDIKSGETFINEDSLEGDFPVLGGGNKVLGVYNQYNIDESNIIIGRVGSAGVVTNVVEKSFATDNALIIRTKQVKNFLYYLLVSARLERLTTSNAQPLITASKILELVSAWPDRQEQERIANILDKKVAHLDKVKALLEEQIETLQDYRQSLIYETVTKGLDKTVPLKDSGVDWIGQILEGWEVKRLKYVLQTPLQYGANATGDNYDETLPRYIRITDIDSNGKLKDSGRQSLSEREALPYILKDRDVLFARSGATVGKTFLYRETYGRSAFAGYLIKAEVNQKMILPEYLVYYTQSYLFDIWKEQSFIQSTIQNIGADKYNNLQIVLCSIAEQAEIIEYLNNKVSKINQMIAIKEEQIDNINQQRQTLIYDFVTGKRRV